MLGIDRRRVLRLAVVKAKGVWGRRLSAAAAAAGLRSVAVVMFVRVKVRMRVGRFGKRMKFIGDGGGYYYVEEEWWVMLMDRSYFKFFKLMICSRRHMTFDAPRPPMRALARHF